MERRSNRTEKKREERGKGMGRVRDLKIKAAASRELEEGWDHPQLGKSSQGRGALGEEELSQQGDRLEESPIVQSPDWIGWFFSHAEPKLAPLPITRTFNRWLFWGRGAQQQQWLPAHVWVRQGHHRPLGQTSDAHLQGWTSCSSW